ncbi:MAG: tetratricopeptide repeat protein [Deltaproteobacteria bacterium]|nr:tetratricopeptide repeat protein [Deltaproteobacteria bacterium]
MKQRQIVKAACVIFLWLCVGCTANLEALKRESEAIRNVGEAYMAEGKYTDALRELLEAEKLYADDPFLQDKLGIAYLAKKRPDLAVIHFKKALELKPDFAFAKNNLGTAYMELKNWDAAISCFKGVAGNLIYATPHFPRFNMGWAYYNKKDYVSSEKYYIEALRHYRDGFQKDDIYYKALRGLGRTYIAMGRLSDARKTIEEALKDDAAKTYPGFEIILLYFDLAEVSTSLGDFKKAMDAYDMIINIAPDTPAAEKAAKDAARLRR